MTYIPIQIYASDYGQTLIASADAAAARTALGLGTAAVEASSSFAAASHTHLISEITSLESTLDSKSTVGHEHIIADITGLQTTLNGKAAASHNHAASEITSGELATARGGRGRGDYTAAGRIPFASSTTLETDSQSLQYVLNGLVVNSTVSGSYTSSTYVIAGSIYGKLSGSNNDSWSIIRATGLRLGSDCGVYWSQNNNANSTLDTGLVRHAAGVVRVTAEGVNSGNLLVGTSGATKNAAAALQIESTTQGFLPSSMTSVQFAAISTPPDGLFVYDTTLHKFRGRANSTSVSLYQSTDRAFGVGANVSNTSSHAFGPVASTDANETVIGVEESSIYPSVRLQRRGLLHFPHDGFAATRDHYTATVSVSGYTTISGNGTLLNGDGAETIAIPTGYAMSFHGTIAGCDTTSGDVGAYLVKGVIKNVDGTTTMVGSTVETLAEDDAAWGITLSADNTNDTLKIDFTGDGSNQTRWQGKIECAFTPIAVFFP